jgi:hypothetical protein
MYGFAKVLNNICFTTTAMPRPELLLSTYESFQTQPAMARFQKDTTLFKHR